MSSPTPAAGVRRFGAFEINLQTGELRKNGMRLRLSGQPFQVLAVLVERRGELVTREELHSKLWHADTFVDFDHGLNNAVARIREVLDDSSDTPRYVETVPRRGYRFIAPLAEIANSPGSKLATASSPSVLPDKKKTAPAWVRAGLGVLVLVALIALVFLLYRKQGSKSGGQPPITSVAVLPLKNLSGDPKQEYLADGLTEELISRLAQIRDLRVTSRTSVMQFKDTKLSVPEIAKTLNVDSVMEGSVIREGNRIRVHAQLIRAATDEHFWSDSYDRELRDVLTLESDVAQAIAQRVEVAVTGEERKQLASVRAVAPEVYESYLKGWSALAKRDTRANVEESISFFNEAIKKDPTYAPSYLGLARAYTLLSTVFMGGEDARPKVIDAAGKALQLDPQLVEAHVLLGRMAREQWRWADSEAEYRHALELRPNDAAAISGFADWLISQGRTDEALAARRRGRELDPIEISGSEVGWALFYARRYQEAEAELRSVLAVRAEDAYALWILGFTLLAANRPEEAVAVLERGVSASNRSPALVGLLVHAYAKTGRRADALQLLHELNSRKPVSYVPAAAFVPAYLGFSDHDQAFLWLEQAYREKSNLLQYLKVHPIFDPLRGDARFVDLVRRVGLN